MTTHTTEKTPTHQLLWKAPLVVVGGLTLATAALAGLLAVFEPHLITSYVDSIFN